MIISFLKLFLFFNGPKAKKLERNSSLNNLDNNKRLSIGKTNQGEAINWPLALLKKASSILILGSSGCGKTILAAFSLIQEIIISKVQSLFILDPKTDLIESTLKEICLYAPHLLDKVHYLNPFEYPFAFNLCHLNINPNSSVDIRSNKIANLISASNSSSAGYKQVELLTMLITACIECDHPKRSLLLALDALTMEGGIELLAQTTKSTTAKNYLLSTKINDELRASCASRIRSSLAYTKNLERMISSSSTVQLDELFSKGSIVLLDLGSPPGGSTTLQVFFSNLWFELVTSYLYERKSGLKSNHHVRLVIDEAHLLHTLDEKAELLLTTGRSRNISLSLLTQAPSLIAQHNPTLLRTLYSNTSTRIVGRLNGPDAEAISKEQSPLHGYDESIGEIRSRFVSKVTSLKDRHFYLLQAGVRKLFKVKNLDMGVREAAYARYADKIEEIKNRYRIQENINTARPSLMDIQEEKKVELPNRPLTRWG